MVKMTAKEGCDAKYWRWFQSYLYVSLKKLSYGLSRQEEKTEQSIRFTMIQWKRKQINFA